MKGITPLAIAYLTLSIGCYAPRESPNEEAGDVDEPLLYISTCPDRPENTVGGPCASSNDCFYSQCARSVCVSGTCVSLKYADGTLCFANDATYIGHCRSCWCDE